MGEGGGREEQAGKTSQRNGYENRVAGLAGAQNEQTATGGGEREARRRKQDGKLPGVKITSELVTAWRAQGEGPIASPLPCRALEWGGDGGGR